MWGIQANTLSGVEEKAVSRHEKCNHHLD